MSKGNKRFQNAEKELPKLKSGVWGQAGGGFVEEDCSCTKNIPEVQSKSRGLGRGTAKALHCFSPQGHNWSEECDGPGPHGHQD